MAIPLICGAYDNRDTVGVGGDCPVCFRGGFGPAGTLELERSSTTSCFCFIPLCSVGSATYAATCRACGSNMPAAVLVSQPGFVSLVHTPWSAQPQLWREQPAALAPTPSANSVPSQPPAGGEAAETVPLRRANKSG
jgi:hypothetical protein